VPALQGGDGFVELRAIRRALTGAELEQPEPNHLEGERT
jgi:hypothetical protein